MAKTLKELRKEREEQRASLSSNGEKSSSLKELRAKRNSVGFENSYNSAVGTLIDSRSGWKDSSTMADYRKSLDAANKRMSDYITNYSPDQSYIDAYDNFAKAYQDFDATEKMYSNFINEDAYNKSRQKYETQSKYSGMSYDELQKALKTVTDSEELKYLNRYTDFASLEDYDKAIAAEQKQIDKLSKGGRKVKSVYQESLKEARNRFEAANRYNQYKQYEKNSDYEALSDPTQILNAEYGLDTDFFTSNKDIFDRSVFGGNYNAAWLHEMNEDMQKMGAYIYNKQGAEAYMNYMRNMTDYVRNENADELAQYWSEKANKNPAGTTLEATLLQPVVGGLAGIDQAFSNLAGYKSVSTLAGLSSAMSGATAQISEKVRENDGGLPAFAYDALTTSVPNRIGQWMFGRAYNVIMGMSSFAQTYANDIKQGENVDRAVRDGLVAGAIEYITEQIGMDWAWGKGKTLITKVLKQAFAEGSEEVVGALAEQMYQYNINGAESEYKRNVAKYVEMGYELTDAQIMARQDYAKDIAYQFAVAAASVGLSPSTGFDAARSVSLGSNVQADVLRNYLSSNPDIDELGLVQKYGDDLSKASKWQKGEAMRIAMGEVNGRIFNSNTSDKFEQAVSDKITLESAYQPKDKKLGKKYNLGNRSEDSEGNEIKVEKVTTKDGKTIINDKYDANDVTLTENDAYIVNRAKEIKNDNLRQLYVDNYNGQDIAAYDAAFELATNYGATKQDLERLHNIVSPETVPHSVLDSVYNMARYEDAQIAKVSREANEALIKEWGGKTYRKGNFDMSGVNTKMLSKEQRQFIDFAKAVSAMGFDITIYDDPNDNNAGRYKNGHIWINLSGKAYTDTAFKENYAIKSFFHESTHMIKDILGDEFKLFAEEVKDYMGDDWYTNVEFRKKNHHLSQEVAEEEVIARFCEDFYIKQEEADKFFSNMDENKFMRFYNRIKAWFKKCIDSLNAWIKQAPSDSHEAQFAHTLEKEFERFRKEWIDMFERAIAKRQAIINGVVEDTIQAIENNDQKEIESLVGKVEDTEKMSTALDSSLAQATLDYQKKHKVLTGEALIELNKSIAYRKGTIVPKLNKNKEKLPADIAGNIFSDNLSYNISAAHSLQCIRSLTNLIFTDHVANEVGRPLTVAEQIAASELLAGVVGNQRECQYCYNAADRKAYEAGFGTYLNTVNALRESVKNNRSEYEKEFKYIKDNYDTFKKNSTKEKRKKFVKAESKNFPLFTEYLNGREMSANMLDRFLHLVEDALNGKTEPLDAKAFSNEENRANAMSNPDLAWYIEDATKWSRSAFQPKKRSRTIKVNGKDMDLEYIAYNGNILEWDKDVIKALNSSFGLRDYSYDDFVPAFILEDMQLVTDAAVRGLKMLSYNKDTDFARVFAPTGMNINLSVYGVIPLHIRDRYNKDKALNEARKAYKKNPSDETRKAYLDALNPYIIKDEMQGANVDAVKALRKEYDNVGAVFVATNDDMVEWALAQDWIDIVIPYHIVRSPDTMNYFGYKNYKGQQEDGKSKGHTDKDLKAIPPALHNNDRETYERLLKENHLTHRFSQWANNPNYMKLVNETRRPYNETEPVVPKFDYDAINDVLQRIEDGGVYGEYIAEDYKETLQNAVKLINAGKTSQQDVEDFYAGKLRLSEAVSDEEYSKLVHDGYTEQARKILKETAKAHGFKTNMLFHGSPTFGFNRFSEQGMSERGTIFFSSQKDVAYSYSGSYNTDFSGAKRPDFENFSVDELTDYYNKIKKRTEKNSAKPLHNGELRQELKERRENLKSTAYSLKTEGVEEFKDKETQNAVNKIADLYESLLLKKNSSIDFSKAKENILDCLRVIRDVKTLSEYNKREDFIKYYFKDWLKELDELSTIEYALDNNEDLIKVRNDIYDRYGFVYRLNNSEEVNKKGIYEVYLRYENPLRIENELNEDIFWSRIEVPLNVRSDKLWDDLYNGAQYATTNALAHYAREAGYDAIIFEHITDIGGEGNADFIPSNVYGIFDPRNVASADLITYDDAGNEIPLSQRFQGTGDIRYSEAVSDEDYSKLAKENPEEARKVLDKAALEQGALSLPYKGTPTHFFHGTNYTRFNTFDVTKSGMGWSGYGFYFSTKEDFAKQYGTNRLIDSYLFPQRLAVMGYRTITADQVRAFLKEYDIAEDSDEAYASRLFLNGEEFSDGLRDIQRGIRGKWSIEDFLEINDDRTLLVNLQKLLDYKGYQKQRILSDLYNAFGFDGVSDSRETVMWFPNQIHSADLITYDDEGKEIPLSERFNTWNDDIRYSEAVSNYGYHAGDLGKAESLGQQTGGRDSGHFGTGTYFVGNKVRFEGTGYEDRPIVPIDFSKYHLWKPLTARDGTNLHEFLKGVNRYAWSSEDKIDSERDWEKLWDDVEYAVSYEEQYEPMDIYQKLVKLFGRYKAERAVQKAIDYKYSQYDGDIWRNWDTNEDKPLKNILSEIDMWDVVKQFDRYDRNDAMYYAEKYGEWKNTGFLKARFALNRSEEDLRKVFKEVQNEIQNFKGNEYRADSASTLFMKKLGYEGVDVRKFKELDNTFYGSVIYDLKGEDLARKQEIGTAKWSEAVDSETYKLLKESEKLKKRNAILEADIKSLKELLSLQGKVTKGQVIDYRKVASDILKEADSSYDRKQLTAEIERAFGNFQKYITTGESQRKTQLGESTDLQRSNAKNPSDAEMIDLLNAIYDIAAKVVDKSTKHRAIDVTYKTIAEAINKTPVSLTKAEREEVNGFTDWRKDLFNVTGGAQSLNDLWDELSKKYPHVFEGYEGSKIEALAQIYDYARKSSSVLQSFNEYENVRSVAENIYDKFWNTRLVTVADKYDAQLRDLKDKHKQAMKELRTQRDEAIDRVRKQKNEVIKHIRADRDQKIRDLKQHYKDMDERKKAEAIRKAEIKKIISMLKDFAESLHKNSIKDNNKVIEPLKGLVEDFIKSIDISSEQTLGMRGSEATRGEATKQDTNLIKMLNRLGNFVRGENLEEGLDDARKALGIGDDIGLDYIAERWKSFVDRAIELSETAQAENTFVLYQMSTEELRELHDVLSMLKKIVGEANQLIGGAYRQKISSLCLPDYEELKKIGKRKAQSPKMQKVLNFFNWDNLLPKYAMKHIGKGCSTIFEELADAQDKEGLKLKKLRDWIGKEFESKSGKNDGMENFGKLRDEDEKAIHTAKMTLEVHKGTEIYEKEVEFEISDANIMSLHCLNQRGQAKMHINQGGVIVASMMDEKGKEQPESETIILQNKDVEFLENLLTKPKEQIERAEKLQKFLSDWSKENVNEATMRMYGIEIAHDENYFPIDAVPEGTTDIREHQREEGIYKLLNSAFVNPLADHPKNPILLHSIYEVFVKNTSETTKYNCYAPAIRDMIKYINYKSYIGRGETISMRKAITEAYGNKAYDYIVGFLKDLGGVKEKGRGEEYAGWMRNYKVAAVAANLQVALLQPVSITRAALVLPRKYLLKAMAMPWKIKHGEDTMHTYSGVSLIKESSTFDVNLSRGLNRELSKQTLKDKIVDKSVSLAGWMDKITWATMWNACEEEYKAKHGAITKDSYEEINKRFREVIYDTQVMDSVMTRSSLMRSQSVWAQMITSFMAEPIVSYNIIQDSAFDFSSDSKKFGKREAFKRNGAKIAKATEIYLVNVIVESVMRSLMTRYRKPDEDETPLETLWKEFLEQVNPINLIPIGRDVYSIMQGYDVDRMDIAALKDVDKVFSKWANIVGGDKKMDYKAIQQLLKTFSSVTGIPVSNLTREVISAWNLTIGNADEDLKVK